MSLRTILIIAFVAATHVAADFYIYKGGSNVPNDGGGGGVPSNDVFILNGVPSCDDLNGSVALSSRSNDVAGGDSWACDGCDKSKSIANWDISRFELDDRPGRQASCVTSGCVGGLTLYGTGGGVYGLESTLKGHQGACQRTSSDEVGPCGIIATDAVQLFHCTTALTANDNVSGN